MASRNSLSHFLFHFCVFRIIGEVMPFPAIFAVIVELFGSVRVGDVAVTLGLKAVVFVAENRALIRTRSGPTMFQQLGKSNWNHSGHQFLQRALYVQMCQVGIELAERGGGFEPDRLQERQIQIAGRAVTVVAVFRVLNVATHVQLVSQTAKQHKRPVVSAAMMVAGGT